MADVEVVLSAKDETKSHVNDDNRLSVKDKTVSEIDTTGDDSEYETLEEDNGLDDDEDEEILDFRRGPRSEHEEGELSDSDSVIIEDERVDGDGEEESEPLNDRKLDDDEDRRNPQYIPKKGTFYEHDDRTLMDGEEEEDDDEEEEASKETSSNDVDDSSVTKKEEGQEAKLKKVIGTGGGKKEGGKVWVDKAAEKWQHDLYNEDEQTPKSTQELIDTYGYDIRNEEAPPKARRRRRYGRGPNKYTRNWEDEDAYRSASLPIAGRGRGRGGGRGRGRTGRVYRGTNGSLSPASIREEFPVLGEQRPRRSVSKPRTSSGSGGGPSSPSVSVPIKKIPKHFNARAKSNDRNQSYLNEHLSTTSNNVPVSVPVDLHHKDNVVVSGSDISGHNRSGRGRGRTRGGGGAGAGSSGVGSDADGSNKYKLEFISSRGRGQRFPPPAFSSLGKQSSISSGPSAHVSSTATKFTPSVTSVTKKFNNIEISSCTFTPNNAEENSRAVVRESVSSGANERRVVTEVPPRMQETSSGSVSRSKRYSAQRQRSLPESTYSPPPPATPPQQAQQQQAQHQHQQQHPIQYYQPQTQPISVPDYPPPPVFNEAVPPPQMVTFIPPGPPPPPVTAPPFPPPPIINYVPTPAAFHTMPLQPPPTVQQAELFQGQNGITYYSTQTQAALPRQTPPRRVKLAIPIMPPPDQAPRGRGRSTEQDAKA